MRRSFSVSFYRKLATYSYIYNPRQKLMAKRQNLREKSITESVKFMSQSRYTASKRKPYRLGTR